MGSGWAVLWKGSERAGVGGSFPWSGRLADPRQEWGGHVVAGKGLSARGCRGMLLRLIQPWPVFVTGVQSTWEVCSCGVRRGPLEPSWQVVKNLAPSRSCSQECELILWCRHKSQLFSCYWKLLHLFINFFVPCQLHLRYEDGSLCPAQFSLRTSLVQRELAQHYATLKKTKQNK